MKMASIIKAGSIVGALTIIGGAAWGFAEYTELRPVMIREFKASELKVVQSLDSVQKKLESLSTSMLVIRFNELMDKKLKNGSLDFSEEQERCRIARVLEYVNVGC